ncbi:MAG: hypothetical protein K9M54_10105 [Kiritimatiellales bacterium]|nr:hypothetical protein [Kiritimatiellales bacterium]
MKYPASSKFVSGAMVAWLVAASLASAEDDSRIQALEKQMAAMHDEIAALKGERNDLSEIEAVASKVHFGGYGEIHGNFEENGDSAFDIHRLVFYLGYDFADWIKLTSETEIEHAFVSDGSGGEVLIEQLYVDFLFGDAVNARIGRLLAPIGMINQHHEPTLFMGVERPNVDKYIIPSTWSMDGAGIFGSPLGWLSYQVYVVGGLDGSGFSADEGVREGRIEERSGLNDPAVTGRIDLFPAEGQDLRIGVSGFYGGTDNANNGGGNGTDNDFGLYSADFEYKVSRCQFRGIAAWGQNSDPQNLPAGTGEEIFGWYLEGGVRVMPESWKIGKLAEADLVPFVRYEEYDTQYKVASGTVKDGANDRSGVTVGVNFPLTRQFVLKADYQFLFSEGATEPNNLFNLGMGWVFQ